MTAELQRSLGRVEGTLESVKETLERIDARGAAYEKRLRTVENRQYWLSGASGALAFIAAKFASVFPFHTS